MPAYFLKTEWSREVARCSPSTGNNVPGLNAVGTPSVSAARFYLPLIEPDMRISRIRLSDGIRGWSPQRADKATPSPVR